MGLWRRVSVLAVVVIALSVVFGLQVSQAVRRSNHAVQSLSMRWSPATATAQTLLVHLVDQETGERGFVITGDASYLEPYDSGRINAAEDVRSLKQLVRGDSLVLAAIEAVASAEADWRTGAAIPEINARQTKLVNASRLVDSGVGRTRFTALRADVANLQQLIGERRDAAQAEVVQANRSLTRWLWASAALFVLLIVFLAIALSWWVLRPVRQLSAALRRVGGGDLTASVRVSGPPEFVAVAEDADAMRRRILDELERSEASREALEQRGPVVVALSEELSPQTTAPVAGLRYATALRPAEGMLAGDWVDVLPLSSDRVALMLLDVSGHGAAAGLEAMRLKHVLTTALVLGRQPHEAMARAAAGFVEDERFATAVIVVLDVVTGELRWANAGHLPPQIVPLNARRVDAAQLVALDPTGPLLSTLGGEWQTRSLRLEVEQMLLAFSDGLTEARDAAGHEFGVDGLCASLSAATMRDVDTAVSVCLAAVRAHAQDPHRDDITMLAVSRDPSAIRQVGQKMPTQAGPASADRA